MSNPKAAKIEFDLNTMAPVTPANIVKVIKGTEPGHYYNVVFKNKDLILGFRHLNENYSPNLRPAVKTRIRLVPQSGDPLPAKILGLFTFFGFEKRPSTPGIHYSVVTDNPIGVIDALTAALTV